MLARSFAPPASPRGLGGDGKPWRIGTEVYGERDILPRDVISRKLSVPNAERIFFIRHALRAGFTIEEIFNLTKIDRWFLVQVKVVVGLRKWGREQRIEAMWLVAQSTRVHVLFTT